MHDTSGLFSHAPADPEPYMTPTSSTDHRPVFRAATTKHRTRPEGSASPENGA